MQAPTNRFRHAALVAVPLLTLLGIFIVDPIPQSLAYHVLADARACWGIPNFLNVVSNIPFLVVGGLGFLFCLGRQHPTLRTTWATFFLGVALVCVGSAYYHWQPGNSTLVWDRLPMTVAFMALTTAVVAEHVGESVDRYLLAPALAIGVAAVLWWQYSDDLRLYIWVQATPLIIVPLLLWLYPARYSHRYELLYALGFYLLAKIFEFYDQELYRLTGETVSGHTLKHLLAAVSTYWIYRMLYRRQIIVTRPTHR